MKKIFMILLTLTLLFSLTSCNDTQKDKETPKDSEETSDTLADESSQDADDLNEDEAMCEHSYKEEVYREAGYGYTGMLAKYCTKCSDMQYEEIPALPSIIEVSVTEKYVIPSEDGSENYSVIFDILIKNTSDMDIRSISGNLTVMKDVMLELKCDFENIDLKANSEYSGSYGYSFQYGDKNSNVKQTVCDTPFEDLTFFFTPSDITTDE